MQSVIVGTLDDIPVGEGRVWRVGDRSVAVFRTHGGEVFATQPECPHLQGPLADGLIGGATVACPLHDRLFDLRTGCGLSHEKMSIETFPVSVSADGRIAVTIAAAQTVAA